MFFEFFVATKSLKHSGRFHQCQLSLLHGTFRQKKCNIKVLRKELNFRK